MTEPELLNADARGSIRRVVYAKMAAIKLRAGYKTPKPVANAVWIPLSRGLFALIDSEDTELVSGFCWSAFKPSKNTYYAGRNQKTNGTQERVYMHRVIMRASGVQSVDHINGNGLDCRKSNMRLCSKPQNGWNALKRSGKSSSKFKGVSWRPETRKWVARIAPNRTTIRLGCFEDEIAAAKAYNEAAKRYFGEFAKLNITP